MNDNIRNNNETYFPSALDQEVIRSYAHATEAAVITCEKSAPDFCRKALDTDIFKNFKEDYTVFGQSANAIAKMIIKELQSNGIEIAPIKNKAYKEIDGDAAYWMGYVIMQWMFRDEKALDSLLKVDYDLFFDAYDVLHTQDVNYAIDFVKEEYTGLDSQIDR